MRYKSLDSLKSVILPYEKILLLCGNNSFKPIEKRIYDILDTKKLDIIDCIKPNPKIEHIKNDIQQTKENEYDCIIAIGGGSIIDYAKAYMYLRNVRSCFIAITTTAGSGSEATKYAVYYENGVKKTFSDETLIPKHVISDPGIVYTAPLQVEGSCFLDALCQTIESLWSKNATQESRKYSDIALECIVSGNNIEGAYFAGKAINITQTTAAHAISYYLTTKHNIPHGNAVSLTIAGFAEHLENHGYKELIYKINSILGTTIREYVNDRIYAYGLTEYIPDLNIDECIDSVNAERLANYPVKITKKQIRKILNQLV